LENEAKHTNVIGAKSLEEFVNKLKSPKKIMLLVKAGEPVDIFIDKLVRDLVLKSQMIQFLLLSLPSVVTDKTFSSYLSMHNYHH